MMKRRFINLLVPALALWLASALPVSAQTSFPVKPPESGEQLQIFTDRSVYGVSEEICFTAFYQAPTASIPEWSTVLYVELIRWNGTKLAQTKVSIEEGLAGGVLRIPATVVSGNYYFRAYTKWMRNYSPYEYAYVPIMVINPNSASIDIGPDSAKGKGKDDFLVESSQASGIEIDGLSGTYGTRQLVELEISLENSENSGTYCISVARRHTIDPSLFSFTTLIDTVKNSTGEIEFLPEISGLSLSGKVVNTRSGEPVKDMKVNLSSFTNSFFFSATASDEDGNFLFTLPHYKGIHELHIAKEGESDNDVDVLVSGEYCHQAVSLPYVPFELSMEDKNWVKQMLLNARISETFRVSNGMVEDHAKIGPAFYGEPTTTIYEKDFIELINLKEFFYEVVYNVIVSNRGGYPHLVVNGQTSLVSYPPLVLMDNIPVPNDEKLLNIPCRMIKRIEVVNAGYVIGDFKYNGIISIFSENKNIAGIELEEDSHFFNYQLFDNHDLTFPDHSLLAGEDHHPDRRNLLFWNPELSLTGEDTKKISFYTSDASGDYVVSVRGISKKERKGIYKEVIFSVNQD